MMTSDERHEVAERLREDAGCSEGSPREVVESYLGLEYDGEDVLEESYKSESLLHLADLIDPTCHDTLPATWDTFECSECGTQWAVSPVYIGPDGTTEHDMEKPSYCPNCGARLVDE